MNEKERLLCVLNGKIPDKVPHFELDFQLFKEAFQYDMPAIYKAGPETAEKEGEKFLG